MEISRQFCTMVSLGAARSHCCVHCTAPGEVGAWLVVYYTACHWLQPCNSLLSPHLTASRWRRQLCVIGRIGSAVAWHARRPVCTGDGCGLALEMVLTLSVPCMYLHVVSFLARLKESGNKTGMKSFRAVTDVNTWSYILFSSLFLLFRPSFLPSLLPSPSFLPPATGGSSRFPDQTSVPVEDYNYFISDFNFEAIAGKLLIGAA